MVYSIRCCGSNGSFQLGLGNDEDQNTLKVAKGLPKLEAPLKMAFGGNHTLILFSNGNLYAAGDNQFGQCGCEAPQTLTEFSLIPGSWRDVSAGWEWSILCDSEGHLYSCGKGLKGELGLGEGITLAGNPQRIKIPEGTIADITSSISHTVVRFDSGKVVGWGACRKGQLGPQGDIVTKSGRRKPLASLWSPALLEAGIVQGVVLGRDRTVLLGKIVKVWGEKPPCKEDLALMEGANSIKAMWSSIHYLRNDQAITEHGEGPVYLFGNNLHGQLYRYGPAKVHAWEVGSEHGLLLLENNTVVTWGWGEHGNCGPKNDESVTFDWLNTIYDGTEEVVMLGGGLATSWVVTRAER